MNKYTKAGLWVMGILVAIRLSLSIWVAFKAVVPEKAHPMQGF